MRTINRTLLIAFAAIGTALPGRAMAGDEDRARSAVAEARGKIEAAEKAGVGGEAADGLARARAALDRADRAIRDDNEDVAYHAAKEADAMAELATATAELRKLETERDQLAGK